MREEAAGRGVFNLHAYCWFPFCFLKKTSLRKYLKSQFFFFRSGNSVCFFWRVLDDGRGTVVDKHFLFRESYMQLKMQHERYGIKRKKQMGMRNAASLTSFSVFQSER